MISIATDFSARPYGRYPSHGPNNGQRFREEILMPALGAGDDLIVDLDGARGLGPSFLDEAFAGLLRKGFTKDDVVRRVRIKSDNDPSYAAEILIYIDEEAERQSLKRA